MFSSNNDAVASVSEPHECCVRIPSIAALPSFSQTNEMRSGNVSASSFTSLKFLSRYFTPISDGRTTSSRISGRLRQFFKRNNKLVGIGVLFGMTDKKHEPLSKEEIERIAHQEASASIFGANTAKDDRDEKDYREAMQQNAPYLTLGIQMAFTVALGAGIGWWLTDRTGNSLWLGLCAGLGAVMGLGYFILVVLRMEKMKK